MSLSFVPCSGFEGNDIKASIVAPRYVSSMFSKNTYGFSFFHQLFSYTFLQLVMLIILSFYHPKTTSWYIFVFISMYHCDNYFIEVTPEMHKNRLHY